MKNILILLFIFSTMLASAQDSSYSLGGVIVYKDSRIDALVKKQASINKESKKNSARTAKGYRLLVINTNKREEAIAAKTKVYTLFPDQKAYLSYRSPYFKLKAGNYKTREEAARYQKAMNSIFPKGVFIINDIVEVKPEKDETED